MISSTIKKLVEYGKIHLDLNAADSTYITNSLCELLKVNEYVDEKIDTSKIAKLDRPDELLSELKPHILEKGLCEDFEIPNFNTKIMSKITPLPSIVQQNFSLLSKSSIETATDYLYDLSTKSGYIEKTAIEKNIHFMGEDNEPYPKLELTINLSKPEKSNKDIARLLTEKSTNYPKCMLCKENVGFWGNAQKPARQTLRTIDLNLMGEDWFMQYSPYVYYNEHCIVINKTHHNMTVTEGTFKKLLDFVERFPHYFVGSNACLPIVGGSILNHEHYQGGGHLMPIHHAKTKKKFVFAKCPSVDISILKWYNSTIRIEGVNRDEVARVACAVLENFDDFTDEENYIFAEKDGEKHNAITPIARMSGEKYVIEIILRNNITTKEHPDGLFHAHTEYHHIKSEGIGLIEAMGLFILPPKVKKAMDETPSEITKEYIDNVCINILKNTAIFKEDEKGEKGFSRFMKKCKFEEVL